MLALRFVFWGLVLLFLALGLRSMEGGKSLSGLLTFGFESCCLYFVGFF